MNSFSYRSILISLEDGTSVSLRSDSSLQTALSHTYSLSFHVNLVYLKAD